MYKRTGLCFHISYPYNCTQCILYENKILGFVGCKPSQPITKHFLYEFKSCSIKISTFSFLINLLNEEFINDKTGVRQESRHVEELVEDKKIVATEDKTVYQVAAEKMSLQERAKSSVYLPPVVKGKVVEQAYTPDEFIDMWTHRQG